MKRGRLFLIGFELALLISLVSLTAAQHNATANLAISLQAVLTLKPHADEVEAVNFSSDGKRVITGSDEGTAKIWQPP